jgi:hypothetical protein
MKIYIKCAEDDSSKYVLVSRYIDQWGREGDSYGQLFINLSKAYYGYFPNFTSIRANNYSRAKLFKSYQDAEAFINKHRDTFDKYPVEIMSYADAMSDIGDPDQNYADYKQKQEADRKVARKQSQERAKIRDQQNKVKDPGTYKVWFYYANSWLGGESFTVEAESVDDAFNKAKAQALRQDPYRNASGYDQRMVFNKSSIKKIK